MRRAIHSTLNLKISSRYHSAQTDEAVILAHDLLKDPSSLCASIQRCSASSVVSMVYGMAPLNTGDPMIQTLNAIALRFTNAAYPGSFLVDLIPVLDYLPPFLAKWKRDAQADFEKFSSIYWKYYEEAVRNNEQKPSLCTGLKEETQSGLSDAEKSWIVGLLYLAGVETTNNTLLWVIHAMILYPEVQRKGQDEIDRVVGRSRTPTFTDMEHLPYVRAIVNEILRWQPTLPLGLAHRLMEDDWYEGHFIPKGTTCIANIWAINRDPAVYGPDATEFRPERFLDVEGAWKGDTNDEGHFTYGFGRRACAGLHVANNALFIDTAMILWALKVEPLKSESPKVATESAVLKSVMNFPPKFECHFVARFPEVETILQDTRDEIVQASSGRT